MRYMPTAAHDIEMYGKGEYHSDGELWRLEPDGCLKNKEAPGKCLALEGAKQGAPMRMRDPTGTDEQVWHYTNDKYLKSNVHTDNILHPIDYLVIDVYWADVPLITDGAQICGWHRDNTVSQKWNMVPAE